MAADYREYPFNMEQLPKSWAKATVGQVLLGIQSGFSSGKHNQTGEGIPHLRPMSVSPLGEITLEGVRYVAPDAGSLRLADDDVLFTNTSSTTWVGKTAVIHHAGDWAFSNHMTRLRVGTGMNSEFVARQLHYLCMCGYFAFHCKKHINQSSISTKQLTEDVPFRCPPGREQSRIVAQLTRHLKRESDLRKALEELLVSIHEYRTAVLVAASSGRLVPTEAELARKERRGYEPASVLLKRIRDERRVKWESDRSVKMRIAGKAPENDAWKQSYKVPTGPPVDRHAKLPSGWVWCTADQVGDIVTGSTPSKRRKDFFGGPIPFFKPADLNAGYEVREARDSLTEKGARFSRLLPPLSILVTCIGATVGKTGLSRVSAATNQQINALVVKPTHISPFWLYWLFTSPGIQRYLKDNARGATLPIINKSEFAGIILPLPPRAEQERIVAELERRFSTVNRIEDQVVHALAQMSELRASLFHRALSGRLVPQKRSDGTAVELLRQIQHEQSNRADEASEHPKLRSRKKTKLPMLNPEDIAPTYLADILRRHRRPLDARALWLESQLSIDDFYAQLKKELTKGIRETGADRLLEART